MDKRIVKIDTLLTDTPFTKHWQVLVRNYAHSKNEYPVKGQYIASPESPYNTFEDTQDKELQALSVQTVGRILSHKSDESLCIGQFLRLAWC